MAFGSPQKLLPVGWTTTAEKELGRFEAVPAERARARAQVLADKGAPALGSDWSKLTGCKGKLFELRAKGEPQSLRLFVCKTEESWIVVHVVQKSANKLANSDVKTACQRCTTLQEPKP